LVGLQAEDAAGGSFDGAWARKTRASILFEKANPPDSLITEHGSIGSLQSWASNLHPVLGTYYLGADAYNNTIEGNSGTAGYDEGTNPIPNNFITYVTAVASTPHTGPQVADGIKFKHDLLKLRK